MAKDNKNFEVSFPAGADLSALQFRVIKLDSSKEIVIVTAITDIPFGILQNKPDAQGKPAAIVPIGSGGISKIVLGATLATGVLVGTSTAGKAVADATTNFNLGILIDSGVLDDIGSVLLTSLTAKA